MVAYERTQIRSGPIPSPQELQQYEHICSGSAQLFLDQWKKQTDHRIDGEKKALNHQIEYKNKSLAIIAKGQKYGFIIAITAMILAGIIVYVQPNKYGSAVAITLVGATLGTLVTAFIQGHKNKKNNPSKNET